MFFGFCYPIFVFPKDIYLPVWFLGVLVQRAKFAFLDKYPIATFILSLLGIFIFCALPFPKLDMFYAIHFTAYNAFSILYYYLIGLFVALNIYSSSGFFEKTICGKVICHFKGVIRWLASKTFSLYLLHLPLLFMLIALFHFISYYAILAQLLLVLIICFAVSEVIENKNSFTVLTLKRIFK
ncbi:hypothetical protein ABFB97_27165 [Klebsiella pneumoniae]|uniref:hypothetical protein n=1 Tax=Klebsiella pneumoniae complex TaxID=3390273 RepID=UPI0007CA6B6A|nr:hypothetical protein [Klebsiella pneumoniae]SAR60147.1 Uncharacterised protein [Klebsiella pneumoniae]